MFRVSVGAIVCCCCCYYCYCYWYCYSYSYYYYYDYYDYCYYYHHQHHHRRHDPHHHHHHHHHLMHVATPLGYPNGLVSHFVIDKLLWWHTAAADVVMMHVHAWIMHIVGAMYSVVLAKMMTARVLSGFRTHGPASLCTARLR